MSIATELTNLNDNILDAYTAVQGKGGAVPAHKNMANLDTAINSIPEPNPYAIDRKVLDTGGGYALYTPNTLTDIVIPHDIVEIRNNVLAYAYAGNYTANVDMSTVRKVYSRGMASFTIAESSAIPTPSPLATFSTLDASSLEEVEANGFAFAFERHNFATISFPALTTVGQNAFNRAFSGANYSGGTTATFGALKTITQSGAFNQCFAMGTSGSAVTNRGFISISFPVLETIPTAASQFMRYGCSYNGKLTTIDFGELKTIYGPSAFEYAFRTCGLVSMNGFPKLEEINGQSAFSNAFAACDAMTSAGFPELKTIGTGGGLAFSNAFVNCSNLSSVDLSKLETVSGSDAFSYAFSGCHSLTSISFPALTTISTRTIFNYAFQNCTSLTSVSFPALTVDGFGSYVNQFNNMLRGVTGCTVHFPAATQAKVEAATGYPNFGGTNTTVLFDL